MSVAANNRLRFDIAGCTMSYPLKRCPGLTAPAQQQSRVLIRGQTGSTGVRRAHAGASGGRGEGVSHGTVDGINRCKWNLLPDTIS